MHGGREQRLLDGVLGGVEVAVPAHERAEDLRRQLAQQVLDTRTARSALAAHLLEEGVHLGDVDGAVVHHLPHLDRLLRSATPSGPGTAEILPAISIARSSDSTSTIW